MGESTRSASTVATPLAASLRRAEAKFAHEQSAPLLDLVLPFYKVTRREAISLTLVSCMRMVVVSTARVS